MMLYVAVTADEYELPICVADTGKELAKQLNISARTLYCLFCRQNKKEIKNPGTTRGYNVVKVKVEDEE